MAPKVLDIDRGLAKLRRTMKSLAQRESYVKAGVLGAVADQEHGEGSDLTNVEVATIQEFGSPQKGIPSRPFVSRTFEQNRDKYVGKLAKGLARVYENKLSIPALLGVLGTAMSTDIKQAVMQGNEFVPNAPSTVAKKIRKSRRRGGDFIGPLESPRPLVDTNRMVGSITHEVVLSGQTPEEGGE